MTSLRGIALGVAVAGGIGTALACSSSSNTPTDPGSGSDLTVTASPALTFGPATLTVNAGDVVTFAFGSVPHNVFFDAAQGAPSDITGTNANVSVQRAFAAVGTYHYTCHIHPGMQGTVQVR